MIPEITNGNLYMLLPGKIVGVVELAAKHNPMPPLDILRQFYASNTYKQLEREETKLWHYGSVALCEEFVGNQ